MTEVKVESWKISEWRYVDSVRWLPTAIPYRAPLVALGLWDPDTRETVLEVSALEQEDPASAPSIDVLLSVALPARVTDVKTAILPSGKSMILASSRVGDISVILASDVVSQDVSLSPVICPNLHKGKVSGMDVEPTSHDCVTAGEDGRINLVKVAQSQLQRKCLFDNKGLMSFSDVCWASSAEFVTGSLGSTLQWWDQRRPGSAVSQSPAKWAKFSGGINCLDVHPSRKHLCVVGGSEGTVFVWDLRWLKEPVALSGRTLLNGRSQPSTVVESEVWKVKYDPLLQLSGHMVESGKVPPVMVCSEDGILAILDNGETIELLVENMAINIFDIDSVNPANVICGLEFQDLVYMRRST